MIPVGHVRLFIHEFVLIEILVDLPASFVVWLCSPEADFLRGKFLWSNWDVEELKAKKEAIENDPSQLVIGLSMEKVVA